MSGTRAGEVPSLGRSVARAGSFVFLGIAGAMVLCAFLGFAFEHSTRPVRDIDGGSGVAMLGSAGISALCGALCGYYGRDAAGTSLTRRDAVFVVNFIWIGAAVLGALPYMVDAGIGPADALFESASGFTTTGATIVADIEGSLSHTLLLWRSLTQWLGGMGIVVLFVAFFPSLGVSGKHMFRSEVPGHSAEGLQPRVAETSLALWRLYLAFTVAETVVLWLLGMDLFESVNHAWTTMSTGGFSTRNASVAGFESGAIEWVITLFMLAAGVNFGLYYAALFSDRAALALKSIELRVYLALSVVITLVLSLLTLEMHGGNWLESVRLCAFTVASTITSTGYGVDDYMAYPPVGLTLIVGLMFVGGMSGSTAGGIKVSRLIILAETALAMLRRSVQPQVVHVVRLDRKVLDEQLLLEVAMFFFLFMGCMGGGTLLIAIVDGVALPTVFGAMLTSLSNMGPAPFYEGADNFVRYSDVSKVVFSMVMILGRLELFTVLALFLPAVWRD